MATTVSKLACNQISSRIFNFKILTTKHTMIAGIFDSGVGGLTVAKSVLQSCLFDEVVYYGDTARVPYGTKDENTIVRYSLEAVEFFKNFEIGMLIVACNTVSAYALDEMRKIAPFEIVGVIEPGVEAILARGPKLDASIVVLGTKATVQSGSYERLLASHGFTNVRAIPTGFFVPLVEEGIFDGPLLDAAMQHYFAGIEPPEYLILGCTHFPLIASALQRYFPNTVLVHSGEAIVQHLVRTHGLYPQERQTPLRLFASSVPEHLKSVAKMWLQKESV